MLITPLAAHLKTACPALRQVLSALSGAVPAAYPAAYVIPLSERVTDADLSLSGQVIEARFGVEIMVKHAAESASGGPAGDALDALREVVSSALVGWCPATLSSPVEFVSGRLVSFEAGLAVWRDEYLFQFVR